MSLAQHLAFLLCVACASYAQTLTGFAFGLVLLGLCAMVNVAPLADIANVASLLLVLNACLALRRGSPRAPVRVLLLALIAGGTGGVIGLVILGWLSARATLALQALLGLAIISCAFVLVLQSQRRAAVSSPGSFAVAGVLSGVLGGLFASPGPPLVYHFYRQPMPFAVVRNSLFLLFGASAALRMVMLAGTGGVSTASLWLTLEALPVAVGIAWALRHRAAAGTPASVRRLVFGLLLAAGVGLIAPWVMQAGGGP